MKDETKPNGVVGYEVVGRPDQVILTGADEKKRKNALVFTVNEVIHDEEGRLDISEDNIKSDASISIPAMDLYLELTDKIHGEPEVVMRELGKKKTGKVVQELVDKGLAFYGKDKSGRKTVEVDVFDIPRKTELGHGW